jgi:hypothetical protein
MPDLGLGWTRRGARNRPANALPLLLLRSILKHCSVNKEPFKTKCGDSPRLIMGPVKPRWTPGPHLRARAVVGRERRNGDAPCIVQHASAPAPEARLRNARTVPSRRHNANTEKPNIFSAKPITQYLGITARGDESPLRRERDDVRRFV